MALIFDAAPQCAPATVLPSNDPCVSALGYKEYSFHPIRWNITYDGETRKISFEHFNYLSKTAKASFNRYVVFSMTSFRFSIVKCKILFLAVSYLLRHLFRSLLFGIQDIEILLIRSKNRIANVSLLINVLIWIYARVAYIAKCVCR